MNDMNDKEYIILDTVTGGIVAPLLASSRWNEIKQNYRLPKLYMFGGLVCGIDTLLFPQTNVIKLFNFKRVQPDDWNFRTYLNVLGSAKLSLFAQGCHYISDISKVETVTNIAQFNAVTRFLRSPTQILVLTIFMESIHQIKKLL